MFSRDGYYNKRAGKLKPSPLKYGKSELLYNTLDARYSDDLTGKT